MGFNSGFKVLMGNWGPHSRATRNSLLPGRDPVSLRTGYIVVI